MSTSKVLALRFNCVNGKKYNVRIKNAYENLNSDNIKELADAIIKIKAFDFDGKQSAYSLESATYTTTQKNAIVSAK